MPNKTLSFQVLKLKQSETLCVKFIKTSCNLDDVIIQEHRKSLSNFEGIGEGAINLLLACMHSMKTFQQKNTNNVQIDMKFRKNSAKISEKKFGRI